LLEGADVQSSGIPVSSSGNVSAFNDFRDILGDIKKRGGWKEQNALRANLSQ
jgi:hypothetical protein